MIKMEEFSARDWDCFAEAETTTDGKPPMTGETPDGKLIVIDAHGIGIYYSENEDE